jgi:LacI family transcriptional regulator
MGARAAEILLDLINGNHPAASVHRIPGELRLRGTLAQADPGHKPGQAASASGR